MTPKPVPTATPVISTEGACGDPAFTLTDIRWTEPFEWYFNADSVPARYDADAVLEVVEQAFDNITDAKNDCGLPDRVSATAIYRGTTDEEPCGSSTYENVVGFGKLSGPDRDFIALMCPFGTDERISFAHVILNTRFTWAVSTDTCRGDQELLEPTLTHEIGHAFGLGHVGERRHGDLTMSTRSNGPCHDEESTLGLGDVLGLEELYGP